MPLDDDADDPADAPRPPLPPEDRLWRHPSEMGRHGAGGGAVPAVESARIGRPAGRGTMAIAGLTGAVLMVGLLSISGHLDSGVAERRVVEKVALTPIVSTPLLRGDTGVASVVRRLQSSIVRLELTDDGGTSTGSGVVFRDDGMVLTSAHLIDDATRIGVRLSDGRRLIGTVVGIDPVTDVAVVDVDATGLPVAVLGSVATLEVGEPAMVIGAQSGAGGGTAVSTGVVSRLGCSISMPGGGSLHGLVQTDAPIARATTGGAMVDRAGAVVGIIAVSAPEDASSSGRFGFAIPIDVARRVAGQLITRGYATHGWLGIRGEDLSPSEAAELGVAGGARVRGIDRGGPADDAGFDDDDVITDVDGEEVDSMPGLATEMRDREPGDEVTVGYWRDGKHETKEVTVGEHP